MVRKSRHISMQTRSAASWLGVVLVAGVWILIVQEPFPTVQAATWLAAALLGWLGFFVMTVTVIYGVSHMPVHRSAVILLFELVAGAVSSQLLSDEMMSLREWLGGALIIAAAYWSSQSQVESRHG